jgi:hypothetical protein
VVVTDILRKPVKLSVAGEVPLENALSEIRIATQSRNFKGLQIHVDPIGLEKAGLTFRSVVDFPADDKPLGEILTKLADSLDMAAFVQRDGVIVLTTREHARRWLDGTTARNGSLYLAPTLKSPQRRAARARSSKAQAAWKKLDVPITVPFPNETPLEAFVKYLFGNVPGLEIRVEDATMKKVGQTLTSPVIVNLDSVPVRTNLALALAQLDLTYDVREDGIVWLIPLAKRE